MRVLAGRAAEERVRKLEQRGATDLRRVEKQVARIVNDVRKKGDKALRAATEGSQSGRHCGISFK